MAVEMNLNEPVVVKKNGSVLVEGVNYEVIASDNSIKVQGLLDYIGSVEHTPSNPSGIVVKDGSKVLVEDVDYTVVKSGNSVTIIGMNNYMGSVAVELPCASNIMYHGHIWTPNPTSDELSRVISGEFIADKVKLNPSEVTREGKTITFRGAGVRCIMIPKAIGQITSLKDVLGLESLGLTFLARGEITFNGINYYLYTGPDTTIDGLDLDIVMSFQ